MIDTAVPTAFRGLIGCGLTAAALFDKIAADEAMGPGKPEEEATAGLVVFLAES